MLFLFNGTATTQDDVISEISEVTNSPAINIIAWVILGLIQTGCTLYTEQRPVLEFLLFIYFIT